MGGWRYGGLLNGSHAKENCYLKTCVSICIGCPWAQSTYVKSCRKHLSVMPLSFLASAQTRDIVQRISHWPHNQVSQHNVQGNCFNQPHFLFWSAIPLFLCLSTNRFAIEDSECITYVQILTHTNIQTAYRLLLGHG